MERSIRSKGARCLSGSSCLSVKLYWTVDDITEQHQVTDQDRQICIQHNARCAL